MNDPAELVENTLDALARFDQLDAEGRAAALARIKHWRDAPPAAVDELLRVLASREPTASTLWTPLVDNLLRAAAVRRTPWPAEAIRAAAALRRRLAAVSPAAAASLFELIAAAPASGARDALVAALIEAPPPEGVLARVFGRLAASNDASIFPAVWAGLHEPRLAIAALDLANELTRRKVVAVHPAAERAGELIAILGPLADRLGRLAEAPGEYASDPGRLRAIVDEGVALAVALSFALGLIGDQRAEGPLRKAMDLPHRRLQAEAAAALGRLGHEDGPKRLAELAADPIARARAIHYLEELGRSDLIPKTNGQPPGEQEH